MARLKDDDACRIAAEMALQQVGVREDKLSRAVRAMNVQPGDDIAQAHLEAAEVRKTFPDLFDGTGRPQTGTAVARGGAAVRSAGWDAAASTAAGAAAAKARGDNTKSSVAKGREEAVRRGWSKP
jgi:hypothetical protein